MIGCTYHRRRSGCTSSLSVKKKSLYGSTIELLVVIAVLIVREPQKKSRYSAPIPYRGMRLPDVRTPYTRSQHPPSRPTHARTHHVVVFAFIPFRRAAPAGNRGRSGRSNFRRGLRRGARPRHRPNARPPPPRPSRASHRRGRHACRAVLGAVF